MENILDFSRDQLSKIIVEHGQKKFRTGQVWDWIYDKGMADFASMSNIGQECREILQSNFHLNRPQISQSLTSVDGTKKWLLKFSDCNEVETVFIPEKNRGTLCISSQVGCALTCKFCHTGTQRLVRNLTSGEILAQVLHAKDELEDWPANKEGRGITNVVLMGMGEPLLNYENVVKAVGIMVNPKGLNISKQKITLSTSGIVPNILRYSKDLGTSLAISLHAVNNTLRNEIVPINKKHPIEELLSACREYADNTSGRRVTFEYVMLKDINDSQDDAKALVKLISGIPAKINLIPFNPWPNSPYECSEPKKISKFASIMEDAGYISPVRTPRGIDIMAACGQLKSQSIRKKA